MASDPFILLHDGRRIPVRAASFLARIAAYLLRANQLAMVIGSTIYLHGVDVNTFRANASWVRHELCHVEQYRRYGVVPFLCLYLWESMRVGYYRNRFEVEARAAE
jgi:hypothetical protein